ncbi:hypothetical protein DKP78_17830, partial [Enterococcus faecium]
QCVCACVQLQLLRVVLHWNDGGEGHAQQITGLQHRTPQMWTIVDLGDVAGRLFIHMGQHCHLLDTKDTDVLPKLVEGGFHGF